MIKEKIKIQGVVSRSHYSKPSFSAGKLKLNTGKEISFSGKIYVKLDDSVVLEGTYYEDPKFGTQFKAENFSYYFDMDIDGLTKYISQQTCLPGIGIKKAEKIAKKFGDKFFDVLENSPQDIAD